MEVSLETQRLWLRPPQMEDAEALFTHYARHPEVPRFLAWKPHTSVADTRTFLTEKVKSSQASGNVHLALVPKDLKEAIGMLFCGMHGCRIHLGYVIGPTFWGKGYMSEAVSAAMHYFFNRGDIGRIEAICDVENIGSARVMEKSGMQREALLKNYNLTPNHTPGPKDVYLYAKVR